MSIEIREATDDDLDAIFAVDQISFGHTMTDAERERARSLMDLERFRVADDAGRIVGVAGSFPLELTVPGGAAVPMTGTTWVSVLPTHRRRGLLRGLLDAVHADGERRGDVVAGLLASEGAIYGRFGYGVATRWRIVELDRRRARLGVDGDSLASSTVTLIDPAASLDELFARYERWRRTRVGEVNRTREWIAARIADQQGVRGALCDDGYALWTVTPEWGEGQPDHELRVLDLVASTPEEHASLWKLLLSIDLVGPIRSRTAVSLDDPLGQLLDDPRQLRTVALNDMLWLKPTNISALFGARRYRVAGQLAIEVTRADGGAERWSLAGDHDGATADRTDGPADLRVGEGDLGALALGGVSATSLARVGRLTGDASAIRFADAFLGWDPLPFCSTSF